MIAQMNVGAAMLMTGLLLGGLCGCGDDDSKTKSSNGGRAGASSFEFAVETSHSVDSDSLDGEMDDSDAGPDHWGATIDGSTLTVKLESTYGSVMEIVLETSEDASVPGDFELGEESFGTFMTFATPYDQDFFRSYFEAGTVTLENCPTKVGEHIRGTLNHVTVNDVMDRMATKKFSGTFDVVLYQKEGDLVCNSAD